MRKTGPVVDNTYSSLLGFWQFLDYFLNHETIGGDAIRAFENLSGSLFTAGATVNSFIKSKDSSMMDVALCPMGDIKASRPKRIPKVIPKVNKRRPPTTAEILSFLLPQKKRCCFRPPRRRFKAESLVIF